MSSKTPTPFSASSEGTKTGSTSSSSAFPSLPSKTPTHFSASGETRRLASLSQAQLGTGRVPLSMQDRLSEVAAQYAAAVKRMEERLEVLLQMKSKNDDSELKAAISTLAKNNHELLVSFSDIQSSLLQQKQRGIKMLSHKVTASMRANECEKYLASFLTSETDSASLLKVQPLDIESESRRREISSAVMTFQRSIIALKSRAKLMHELQDVDGDMRLLVSINETRKKLQGVEEDATRVERGIRNAVDCGQDIRIRLPSHRTTKDRSIQAGKGNYRNEVNWKDVENHLSTFSGLPRRTKLEMSLETQIVRKKSVDERQPRLSSTGKQHQKQLQLFSPPLSLHPRAGWDEPSTVDQAKMQALTYSAPSQLKSFAIDSAARGALSDFGTTPERVRDSFALSNRTGSLEARNESLSSKLPIGDLASKSPQSKLSESPLKKDGSKPSKIIDSPKESFKATFTLKNDADPPLSFSLPKDAPAETSEEKTFGLNSMHGLGTMLFTDSKNSGSKSSLFEIQPSGSDDQVDFHKLLTEFYTEHNASKLSEVPFVLSKYKGREGEMFAKLAKRYGVANPLEKQTDVSKSATKSNPLFSSEQAPNAQMPLQQKPPMSQSPFGNTKVASSASSFGSPGLSGSSIQDSKPVFGGFGNTSASNFGLSTTSSLSFGGNTVFSASQSPFSAPSSNTPFGSANAIQTQSTSAPMFNGKSARELLVEFYRNHNPAKVDEADRLLEKYHGNEEALFRNLAKKYNLDPSIFGLTSAPALAPGGFGSHSSLGTGGLGGSTVFGGVTSTPTPFGSSGFGSASPLGQSSVFGSAPVTASTTPSGSVFGAAAGSTSFGASGFGSLAQSSAGQGFGSLGSPQPTATFGASSPFGAPRR
ncbi:hypothetical protein FisN_12Hh183 [Fistulifera solaris]|uniref:Uncharacterized protein n=1 Tax=Fistulifera solaris TaxID=1519565 RepID=A0A1Z5KBZ0_FISSO|nr:hypothetical protein FisN_12Hh183 [Fistulifera solaris]|eukprot:GAX23611.1 hypothetical protein FisN_12Hh183 [Fistulifera solaris]